MVILRRPITQPKKIILDSIDAEVANIRSNECVDISYKEIKTGCTKGNLPPFSVRQRQHG
jgi:hypothetical protein